MKLHASDFRSAPVLALGFRPFFILAGIFGVVAMALWGLVLAGLGPALGPLWHGHEMLLGYTSAVIAGFLLTAVTNWTRRSTLVRGSLAAVALLWVAARIVVVLDAAPDWLKAVLCAGFFVFLAIGVGRPIIATGKKRNYGILGVLAVFAVLELVFWLAPGMRTHVLQTALLFILVLVAIIGGRVLPAFTRNATPGLRVRPGGLRRDYAAIVSLAVLGVLLFVPATPHWLVAAAAAFAAVVHAWRMLGWGGRTTFQRPVLWVLHGAYMCLPIGLALVAAGAAGAEISFWTAAHVLTIGTIGLMTLGMMTRVTLGHTGRVIGTNKVTTLAYALLIAAVIMRVGVPLVDALSWRFGMVVTTVLWTLAYLIFVVAYTGKLLAPRPDGKPG